MSFLDEVRADRQPLAHVLKKHRGIRKLVEDLYPDRAHFIYELLQNAVDAKDAENIGATKACFALEENSVSFEHNGRPFSEEDIWGITDIGEGTKAGEEDKIGRFGVGFKAVFAYSETPHIWSPTFSFKISELVLPAAITTKPNLGQKTRFAFPFNSPKKSAQDAYAEVEAGLDELAETTLLFLSHLESIRWQSGRRSSGEVLRIQHSENHIEVLKKADGKTAASSHFLRFSEPVNGLDKQHVSVAFALDFLPNVTVFDPGKALAKQLKIVPANPGRVAVFFPAEKETSGLRFHLHAPFVPELSRASIKKTAKNLPLFKQLAELAAASLHFIRDQNLLTGDFLSVLPNLQDTIPARYQPIRAAILAEMNNQPLTPTYSKSHAPAKHLLQAKAALKELLSPEDIEFLVDYDDEPPQWAIGASQKSSNADRFLSGLDITDWDTSEFVDRLEKKATVAPVRTLSEDFMQWLAAKPVEWHQQMYSLLYKELSPDGDFDLLKTAQIVRLSDGSYSIGAKCYFPSEGAEHDEMFPRVAKGVYSSGKSKAQQEEAKKLLVEIGVREVGEVDHVQAILKQRYTVQDFKPDMKDLKRFIHLVDKSPQQASIFADYYIFLCDTCWSKPSQVFLDSPYLETGLSAYYQAIGNGAPRVRLAPQYEQCGIPIEKLRTFAQAVGVQTQLEIVKTSCQSNPAVRELVWGSDGNWSEAHGIDSDYTIECLKELLPANDEALSRLVWRTACDRKDNTWLRAQYRNNSWHQVNYAPSQLVCMLKDSMWVPQTDGRFVRPAEASRELLPGGFPFDVAQAWLKAVCFGEVERKRADEQEHKHDGAQKLGFADADALERAQRFAALPLLEQERFLAEVRQRLHSELPEHEPGNPELRAERVGQQAAGAPERITEERIRSVSVGREEVKQEAAPYLCEQYTNAGGEMICQVCKAHLPFKLDDGSWFFEKVEFLPKLRNRHYQNYLALCPNHAAMYRHANGSENAMQDKLLNLKIDTNELEVVLAQEDRTIFFTRTHIADLKAVIEAEQAGTNEFMLNASALKGRQ